MTTLQNQTVQMYGSGLYRSDTYFKAPIIRGLEPAPQAGATRSNKA